MPTYIPPRNGGSQPRTDRHQTIEQILSAVPEYMSPEKDPYGELLIKNAERLGEHLAKEDRMTTAQIRKLFSQVKGINFRNNGPYEVNMLKAKLAYLAGRFREVQNFRKILDRMLSLIGTDEGRFKRFQDFFEAVVAYHRNYGGKE